MTDPGVQLVRQWLQHQQFSLRILTLILFMEEAVKDEFGEETMKSLDRDLKEGVSKTTIASGRSKLSESTSTVRDPILARYTGIGDGYCPRIMAFYIRQNPLSLVGLIG